MWDVKATSVSLCSYELCSGHLYMLRLWVLDSSSLHTRGFVPCPLCSQLCLGNKREITHGVENRAANKCCYFHSCFLVENLGRQPHLTSVEAGKIQLSCVLRKERKLGAAGSVSHDEKITAFHSAEHILILLMFASLKQRCEILPCFWILYY